MTDHRAPAETLERDLRSYFVATTGVTLPTRVAAMSVRTLTPQRRPVSRAMAGVTSGVALAAVLLVLLVTHLGGRGGGTTSGALSAASSAAGMGQPQKGTASSPGVVAYPGVDASALGAAGVRLLPPSISGPVPVTATRARTLAVESIGDGHAASGAAVLAQAVLTGPPQRACQCWVVAVTPAVAGPGTRGPVTDIVLIDAVSGAVVADVPVATSP